MVGTTASPGMPEDRRYPMPAPENDPRFTFGLLNDTAEVLKRHGYPKLTGLDLVELRQVLFGFLDRSASPQPTNSADRTRGRS